MENNKEIRKKARKTIKKNYFTLVFVCLVVMFLAGNHTTTYTSVENLFRQDIVIRSEVNDQVNSDTIEGSNFDVTAEVLTDIFHTSNIEEIKFKESVTGGLCRTIFDGITNAEKFLFRIVKNILDLFVNSKKTIVLGILVLLIQLLYQVFISRPLRVAQSRVFMESRLYYKTPFIRIVQVVKKSNYLNVVKGILLTDIYQLLWDLTIVGGIIKRYSYRLVPMILAENPNIKARDAINLSRKMMDGHKLQLFKMDMSFIIYEILDILSFGIVGIIFSNPYYTATMVEFYSQVRELYDGENKELLNDKELIKNENNTQCYPGVKRRELKTADDMFHYYQKYSLTSLILMFFSFSFLGWLWEVLIYIFKDGVFVNRGTMHGPILPIYGFGCIVVLFLVFLPLKYKKYIDNPIITFFVVVLLCGTIEYSTSLYLELTQGMRWWDYTGYFLNINGRVCFEGLFLFGIGGCLCLYIVAPYMQKLIAKIPKRVREALCFIFVLFYILDLAYSSLNPNIGAGITDDADRNKVPSQIETEMDLNDSIETDI